GGPGAELHAGGTVPGRQGTGDGILGRPGDEALGRPRRAEDRAAAHAAGPGAGAGPGVAAPAVALIQFFHVSKQYPGGQTALDEVTFDIPRGQFVFLTGASGAGKTTLLRMIFREEVPSSGQIVVNGRNVAAIPRSKIPYLRRTIGVVFQDFRLIARKTI